MVKKVNLRFVENAEIIKRTDYIKGVRNILISNNNDFVPSLHERIEHEGTLEEKIDFRINEKLEQGYHYILAVDEFDEVIGFTEMKVCNVNQAFNRPVSSINIGTSAIHKELQGSGIAKLLYTFLDDLADDMDVDVVVRNTWSTNARQLKLYCRFGYEEIERIPNFRGEGIDSVKFCKWFKGHKLN